MLEKCTFDHETRIENLQNELREKALSDEKWRKIQLDLNESVSNNSFLLFCGYIIYLLFCSLSYYLKTFYMYYDQGDVDISAHMNNSLTVDPQPRDSGAEELDALRGRYIRRLTAVLVHHIPAFWKVALSVSSGKFAKVITI